MTGDGGRPWLSVLIPVYNVATYLRECVESVLVQADRGVEILLLDDGSTDGSERIAAHLQTHWPQQITLLRHADNQGLSAARNSLMAAARGRYLWFLDSDDFLLPGAIGQLRACIQSHAPELVLCDFQMWRARPRLKHRLRGESHRRSFAGPARQLAHDRVQLLRGLMLTGQMHAWSKIASRTLWQRSGLQFPRGAYYEDMATMPRLALAARSFAYVPEPWVAYRQREGSILSSTSLVKASDLASALLAFSADYQGHVAHDGVLRNAELEFAIAHLATRNFLGAMRAFSGLPPDQRRENPQVPEQFLAYYQTISPLAPRALLRAYLRRGWWLRYWKVRGWLQTMKAL
ncbi:glycosyl transferase family 2 [Lampropedia cohaerens]|uniref:Glycosyl transferase family 2 n=1 Tax=Lampropedia cohaerens TaxID=1610491 RepID=A0A0U1Q3A7_9BURK|nr:glycosyltransferase family 2 protein [Lampropedia cohaerens]KKW69229.1 glycosyl transferase family 2 [Lampropedia cohaerens]